MHKSPLIIKDDKIIVLSGNIDDLVKAVKIMKKKHIPKCEMDIFSYGYNSVDPLYIHNNLSILEEISKEKLDISFYYDEDDTHFPLEKIIRDEKILNLISKEILAKNLSPLERFIAVFQITTLFKPYHIEETENMNDNISRSLYHYLNNNYMCCAGYADLLTNLCSRVNIPVMYADLKDLDPLSIYDHAQNIVHINDPKYNVSGYFYTDSTPCEKKSLKTILSSLEISNILFSFKTQERSNYKLKKSNLYRFFKMSLEEFLRLFSKDHIYLTAIMASSFSKIDPEFYHKVKTTNKKDLETAKSLYEYMHNKFNCYISSRTLLEALINVNKTVFLNTPPTFFKDLSLYHKMDMMPSNIFRKQIENFPKKYPTITIGKLKSKFPLSFSRIYQSFTDFVLSEISSCLNTYFFKNSSIIAYLDQPIKDPYIINLLQSKGYKVSDFTVVFPPIPNEENMTLEEYKKVLHNQCYELEEITELEFKRLKDQITKEYTNEYRRIYKRITKPKN